MAKHRRGRINDEVLKEMAGILREVKDPRVRDAFVSVTEYYSCAKISSMVLPQIFTSASPLKRIYFAFPGVIG